MNGADLRNAAQRRVARWYLARERSMNPSHTHPVAAVQELALSEDVNGGTGRYTARGTETRGAGKSRPLIVDMPPESQETELMLRHVRDVHPLYYDALVAWARRGLLKDAAGMLGVSKPTAYRYLEAGTAILMSRMLDA